VLHDVGQGAGPTRFEGKPRPESGRRSGSPPGSGYGEAHGIVCATRFEAHHNEGRGPATVEAVVLTQAGAGRDQRRPVPGARARGRWRPTVKRLERLEADRHRPSPGVERRLFAMQGRGRENPGPWSSRNGWTTSRPRWIRGGMWPSRWEEELTYPGQDPGHGGPRIARPTEFAPADARPEKLAGDRWGGGWALSPPGGAGPLQARRGRAQPAELATAVPGGPRRSHPPLLPRRSRLPLLPRPPAARFRPPAHATPS